MIFFKAHSIFVLNALKKIVYELKKDLLNLIIISNFNNWLD